MANAVTYQCTIHPDFRFNGDTYTVDSLRALATQLVTSKAASAQEIGQFFKVWLSTSNTVTVNTSGSTGTPKPITLLKSQMQASALATGAHFKLGPRTSALLCLPAGYIAGKMMLVRAITLGWHLDTVIPSASPLKEVQKTYHFCAMTPLQLSNSVAKINLIKKLIVGGGSISRPLLKRIQGVPTQIFETYGMTETITHIATRFVNNPQHPSLNIPFTTLPNVTVGQDKRGCLVINAPSVNQHPIVTNDLVDVVSQHLFYWQGRVDHIINSGGVKLNPEQIERKLAALIEKPFFVTAIPDSKLGQQLVLVVESTANFAFAKADTATLPLSKFEFPKQIITIPQFCRTPTGKVQRALTMAAYFEKQNN